MWKAPVSEALYYLLQNDDDDDDAILFLKMMYACFINRGSGEPVEIRQHLVLSGR